jgi:hypothetical protein
LLSRVVEQWLSSRARETRGPGNCALCQPAVLTWERRPAVAMRWQKLPGMAIGHVLDSLVDSGV